MTQRAFNSLRCLDRASPTSGQTSFRSTQLFRGRVPEFAQVQWLAVQRSTSEGDSEHPLQRRAQKVNTYAVMEDGLPVVLFFFQLEKKDAIVLNEAGEEAGSELRAFSRYVFRHFPGVRRIRFHARYRFIQPKGKRRLRLAAPQLTLPSQSSLRLEEAIRFNRRNVTYFLQRLKQDHPDFHIECHADSGIPAGPCRALLQLNRPQLAGSMNTDTPLDEASESLLQAARQGGMVCLLKIGGRIAAGAICLRKGSEWQLRFLTHDPHFQAYGLGMLCCYFTVCEHIDRQRNKAGATINRPRPTHVLAIRQKCEPTLTIHRPHASLLIRADCAIYATSMAYLQRMIQLRDDCVQLGQALVRLMSAWKLAYLLVRKRIGSLGRTAALPAFLRSH